MSTPAPRDREQRVRDTLARLERDVDCWVATAGPGGGEPYLIPLSFLWDGETLLLATASATPTARNLLATRTVRLGLGELRDVALIEGTTEAIPEADIPDAVGDAFAAKTGFGPRREPNPYLYLRVRPRRIQGWREVDELAGRELMRAGEWVVG